MRLPPPLIVEAMQAQHKIRRDFRIAAAPIQYASPFPAIIDGRYEVRISKSARETASALRLRHEVFKVEIGGKDISATEFHLEFDAYDFKCRHLIVIERETGMTVGTYRLNTIETAGSARGFYSFNEFTIEDLPSEILENGIEIGRACIAKEHRSTKVLFLLWKALLAYIKHSQKRYFFGCCSIFSQDVDTGRRAYGELLADGKIDQYRKVMPRHDGICEIADGERTELPALFNMYLRLGAKVCGPPMIDHDFGSIDFFVVFDVNAMSEKYRRMFA